MDIERIDERTRRVLGLREVVEPAQLTDFFGQALDATAQAIRRAGLDPAGPPTAIYRGDPAHGFDVSVGYPVVAEMEPPAGLEMTHLPAGPAVQALHRGPYDRLSATYDEVTVWMRARNLKRAEMIWEEYLTGPSDDPDPSAWQTRIIFPVASG